MKSIADKQQEVVAKFAKFSDWEGRYQEIIKIGKDLTPMAEEHKCEKNRVKGCQSQVWLHAELKDGLVYYQADSDAMIVRGLAAILLSIYSGHSPQEIMQASSEFLSEIGLTSHLSQSRANGLASMVKQFKNYAIAFSLLV